MAPPPPPPYDPYAGYPVAPVPMPTPAPIAAPSSYVPVQVKWFNLLMVIWFHIPLIYSSMIIPLNYSFCCNIELIFFKYCVSLAL